MKFVEAVFTAVLISLLAAICVSAFVNWQYTHYIIYSFFSAWGLFFLYYILVLRNYYSAILLGIMAGAGGLLLALLENKKATPLLLLGKVSFTIFIVIFALKLYKLRSKLEKQTTFYLALLAILVFQLLLQNGSAIAAFSSTGFINYFTVGAICTLLLNANYSHLLNNGERAVFIMQAFFSLYNISLMLIAGF